MFKSLTIVFLVAAFCSSAFAQTTYKFVDKKGTEGTLTVPAVIPTCLQHSKHKTVLDYKGKREINLCNTSSQGEEIFLASFFDGSYFESVILYTGEAFADQMFQLRAYRESGYDYADIQNPDADGLCDERSVGYLTFSLANLNFCLKK